MPGLARFRFVALAGLGLLLASCAHSGKHAVTVLLAGNSVSRQVYERGLIPAFTKQFEASHPGQTVNFIQSYDGSGAQARAIEAGLKADIAVLSLAPEMDKLADKGFANKDWQRMPFNGVPAKSTVILEVRKGNPKHIKDWDDLARADVDVIMPNPDTSGAAKYNVAAMSVRADSSPGHQVVMYNADLLRRIRPRIKAFGKSGKEAQQIFSSGLGDVLVGWESEALDRKAAGDEVDVVYPASGTVLIEPPVAVITPRGRTPNPVAIDFIAFLSTADAQRIYGAYHYRPSDPAIEQHTPIQALPGVRKISDLGGWKDLQKNLFGKEGIWPKSAQ